MFQSGTWPALKRGLANKFHHCILSIYRRVIGNYHGSSTCDSLISDSELIHSYNLVSPDTFLRHARLSLFGRLAVKAPDVLMSLVLDSSEFGWSLTVSKDLRWLTACEQFADCQGFSLVQWVGVVRDSPKRYKRFLNRFAKSPLANLCDKDEDVPRNVSKLGVAHECSMCDKSFASFQCLSLHMLKKHCVKNTWRHLVGYHTHCPVCLKHFWTRERLINHIRYRSRTCKYNMQLRGPIVTEEVACEIDALCAKQHCELGKLGKRRHFASEPAIRLSGPLLPIMLGPGIKASMHHPLGFGHNYCI